MWLAVTFAAIGLTSTGFMVWFLHGLLGERGPSNFYLIIPTEVESARATAEIQSRMDVDDDFYVHRAHSAPLGRRPEHVVDLLENRFYATESASGLIVFDIRLDSSEHVWRSNQSKPGCFFRELRP
jgi:hypothetical protein